MSSNEGVILATGILVAVSCAIVGSFLMLRKMAMIGDAISHAVLPGIVVAFLMSGSRDSLWMLLAATAVGLLTVFLIQWFHRQGVQSDASIGVIFTAMFSIGVVLVSLYADQVDLDLDCVLFGEINYVPWTKLELFGVDIGPKSLWALGLALLLIVGCIGAFYKQFKLCAFDPFMAAAVGIPAALFHYALMGLVSVTTVASFESVGAILVLGMIVIPPASAYLMTEKLSTMILYAILYGVASVLAGYFAAAWLESSITGTMVAAAGVLFVLTLLLSPTHGLLWKTRRTKRVAGAA
ncbi:metal ABC transporter permease [Paenibacillus sp.]|uniref:metal ABC transporter permease n=1 Tax=Paenibacillus sp. TaxID=58172 RepID=UPI002811846F|nr:metal ABC transporter permease [Paenibacillus sp.]